MSHKYAKVFQWIEEGHYDRIMGRRVGLDQSYSFLWAWNSQAMNQMMRGTGEFEFMLKPATISIAGVECPGPVLSAHELDENCVIACSDGGVFNALSVQKNFLRKALENGFVFQNEEHAKTTMSALKKLLTGRDD
jgi:hypothetical protein